MPRWRIDDIYGSEFAISAFYFINEMHSWWDSIETETEAEAEHLLRTAADSAKRIDDI